MVEDGRRPDGARTEVWALPFRRTTVWVTGAGRLGLVVAAGLSALGQQVTCYDAKRARVAALASGRVPDFEPGLEALVREQMMAGALRFRATCAPDLEGAPFVFLCVDTPADAGGGMDPAPLQAAVTALATSLRRRPVTVVVKSTVPPGTGAAIEAQLRAAGKDATVVSNPEFLREGTAVQDFFEPDRMVFGAATPQAAEEVARLFAELPAPCLVTDTATAEMVKWAANAYLATKLSFANELAGLCELAGADVSVVVRGLGLDPRIGPAYFRPGLGFGGGCLPKDLRALASWAQERGGEVPLLRAAQRVNEEVVGRWVDRLGEELGELRGRRIGVLGLAFKPHTDDLRESPAVSLVAHLLERGARPRAYDPAIPPAAVARLGGVEPVASLYEAAAGAAALVLATEWPEFLSPDWRRVQAVMAQPLVVDGRLAWDRAAAEGAGLRYVALGRRGPPAAAEPWLSRDGARAVGAGPGMVEVLDA